MKKPLLILALSASFIAGTMIAGNFVFADPADGQVNLLGQILSAIQSQEPVCPAGNVQHWETIAWGSNVPFQHDTLPFSQGGISKVTVDQNIGSFTFNEAVAAHLNNLGYSNAGNPITAGDIPVAQQQGEPYVICAES